MDNISTEQTRVRQKQFTYNTAVRWTGEKIGILSSDRKADLTITSPPEFKGTPGLWTPEDMFVGALETCQLLTFLSLAKRKEVTILSYSSTATGQLELLNGNFRFTKVTISPEIVVNEQTSEAEVLALVQQAHHQCLVAKSVTATVEVFPRVLIESTETVLPYA